MSTDIVFLVIIAIYCAIGMKKGFIRSIGGLIATIASWLLSRTLAIPVSNMLMANTNLGTILTDLLQPVTETANAANGTIAGAADGLININGFELNSQAEALGQTVVNILNKSGHNIVSMITMVLLFSALMFVFSMIIKIAQNAFELIPLGKTINWVFGGVTGIIKGLIISVIIYYLFVSLNLIFQTSIPVDDSFIPKMIGFIQNIKF